MEISPFELLLKPIAPRTPGGTPADNRLLRQVIQGYFLTVSNLKEQERNLKLFITISATELPPNDDPTTQRELENNTFLLFDIAGINRSLPFNRITGNNSFIKYETTVPLVLPSLATVSIQLLPDIANFINNRSFQLEVRGFASIISVDGEEGDVFLNPEIRGTFIPDDFETNPIPDFDQLSYSLGAKKVTI